MSGVVSTAARTVMRLPQYALIGMVRAYQLFISPLLGPRCKYYPSCSSYGLEAVRRHGAVKGFALATWRVLRCNPWSHGGVDDVPAVGSPLFHRVGNKHQHGAAPIPHAPLNLSNT